MILLMERFGWPIMKSCSVICGLLFGCIIAGATGYFAKAGIVAESFDIFELTDTLINLGIQSSLMAEILC